MAEEYAPPSDGQPSLTAYNPTWRDRIGAVIAGESNSPMRRRIAQETVGSSGIGTTNITPLDFTPLGMALSSQEAFQQGDSAAGAGYAMGAIAPGTAPAMRALVSFIRSSPRLAAMTGGAAGAVAIPSEAESVRLTRAQQREIELERQRLKAQAEGDLARAKSLAEQQRMDREAAAKQAMELERMNRENKVALEQAEKDRQANMPFRDRFPNLASALPFAGGAAALAFPYLARLRNTMKANRAVGDWESRVTAAEQALPKADKVRSTQFGAEMKALREGGERSTEPSKAMVATSAMLPAEAALLPYEYDALMLPSGNKDKEAAMQLLLDPAEVAKRAVPGLLQGIPAAMIGAKLPAMIPQKVPPIAQTEGLEAAFRAAARRADRAKKSKSPQ